LEAQKEENYEEFKDSVHKAQQVVRRLMGTLDFHYPVSKDLHALYRFINELLSLAIVKNTAQNIIDAKRCCEICMMVSGRRRSMTPQSL